MFSLLDSRTQPCLESHVIFKKEAGHLLAPNCRFLQGRKRLALILMCLCILGLFTLVPTIQAQEISVPGAQSIAQKSLASEEKVSIQSRKPRDEIPLSKRYNHIKPEKSKVYRLPRYEPGGKQTELPEKVLLIGIIRTFERPLDILRDGTSYTVPEGTIYILRVISEGALSVRIHFTEVSLPSGARVFIYSVSNPDEIYGPFKGSGPSEDRAFWSPPVEGQEVVVEYFVPNSVPSKAAHFKIAEIGHKFFDPKSETKDAAESCEIDVGPGYATVAKAVGYLEFVVPGGIGLCTGTLLNTQTGNFIPFLITANHCISTQTAAQSLRVYWNYNSGDTPPSGTPFTDGAKLLSTNTTSDYTFLRLTGDAPSGLWYNGWTTTMPTANTSIIGIHHPSGSHKRISFGYVSSLTTGCPGSIPSSCGNFIRVYWNNGVTEGGSSGSEILVGSASDPRYVGNLWGGYSSCANPNDPDWYGRFDLTYPNISSYLAGTEIYIGQEAPAPGLFIDAAYRNSLSQYVIFPPINKVHRWNCSTCSPADPTFGKGLIQDFNDKDGVSHDALMLADTNTNFVALIYGGMWSKFIQLDGINFNGNFLLGYPIADRNCSDYNASCFTDSQLISPFNTSYHYQRFQGGALVLHKSGSRINQTFEVHGAIRTRWQALGGPSSGSYGLPISDEYAFQSKRRSDFEGGSICYNPATGQTEDGCVTNSPPPAPTASAATSVISSSFTANWSSSSTATGYRLDVSTNSSFSSYVSGYQNLDVGNVLSRSITGLSANTTYYYRVRAYNSVGTSSNSNIITVTTTMTVPSAPTANAATNVTTSSFTANWNSSSGATGYRVDVSTSSSFGSFVSGYQDLDVGNVLSRNVSGLNASTTYYYRVRAYNSAGTSGNSSPISVTTSAQTYNIMVSASPSSAGTVSGSGTFAAGSSRTVTATANTGYTFSNWTESGSVVSTLTSYTFTLNANRTLVANFTTDSVPVSVAVQTNPSGLSFTVDGNTYTTPRTFSWTPGTSHSISTSSPQSGGVGTQYVWSSWSDGGAISHNVVAPASSTTYTANFNTQYFLTMSAGSGGSVSPASNWYASGQSVTITASPNSGFIFGSWSGSGNGSYTGANNPSTVTMNGPVTEMASFTAIQPRLDSVSPAAGRASGGQQIRLAGSFANLSVVRVDGVSASWSYTNGISEIAVITPAHAVGAVSIELVPTTGNTLSKSNAFAYLPTTFTDNTLVAGVTTAKVSHIIELRQAVDALRAVAGLQPAPWTEIGLVPFVTVIRAVHIRELRTYLDDVMTRLGYPTQAYTDPSLTALYVIKRVYLEELRQRIRAIAG